LGTRNPFSINNRMGPSPCSLDRGLTPLRWRGFPASRAKVASANSPFPRPSLCEGSLCQAEV
jgi:hypothetical protein